MLAISCGFGRVTVRVLCVLALLAIGQAAAAQETRGTIFGTVRDSSGAVLPGMTVLVTNEDTNVSNEAVTNASGAYEIPYLLPGPYRITVEAEGFRRFTETGIVLTVNSRLQRNVTLEVGAQAEEVTVTAEAPLLETTASASASLSNRQVNSLPIYSNSATLLARSVPGMQWTADANYLGLHSNSGASAIDAAGSVGGNEYSLDGVPNLAGGERIGYLPYTDTIAEIKIETAGFDASKGHSSNANISMLTKSGTNQYRGSTSWQYWNPEWNATPSTVNAAHYGRIEAAEEEGRLEDAAFLRSQPKVLPGWSHNWSAVLGGPVSLPRLFEGNDKVFFFFSYNGFRDRKTEQPTNINRTVPTEAQRRGDFSELLEIDPVKYQIYDPRTARIEDGRVVRDPFPDNQVPILNPMYDEYLKLFPMPNDAVGIVDAEGRNNYLAANTPYNWDYKAFSNRIDWNISSRHRTFVRWSYNDFFEDRGDWTFESMRGLHAANLVRTNIGATVDHVFTQNASTIWNVSIAYNRFKEGNTRNAVQESFTPASVGLPAYLDERAAEGPCNALPTIDLSDYTDMGVGCGGFTHYSIGTVKGELTKLWGTHSVRMGADFRMHYRSNRPGGQTASRFSFGNSFVREKDNTDNAGNLGLSWAAFMLGVPTSVAIEDNDSYYLSNPYYAGYVQDDWRVSDRLTLNLGLRYELEGGFVERHNRGIGGGFDADAVLPISEAAEAAYLRNPIPEVAAIEILGGNYYLGADGQPRALNDGQHGLMPRVGAVLKLDDRTVLRGGYGWFYDTNNVLNDGIDQFGYSYSTNTTLTNDNGLTFLNTNLTSPECRADPAACRTILADPFPARFDGTRFNTPPGNALGNVARAGRSFDYSPRDWERVRQQRWRIGVQRELGSRMVAEVAYLGSYVDNLGLTQRLNPLAEEYWADGLERDSATADFLNERIPNPFHISNFEFLRTDNPVVYHDLAENGFFTSETIQRHQLLRAYPHMTSGNGLRQMRTPIGKSKYHHVELSLQQRLWGGVEYTVAYTRAWDERADFFFNEFETEPTWRTSNSSIPHHLMVTAITELPFGEGKPWLSRPGILRALAGGWQLSGIYHLQSGLLLDWPNAFYYGDNYEDILLPSGERDRERWFNTDNFATSSSERPASFHRRVFPQRLDFLRADHRNQLDMRLTRSFSLGDNRRFEIAVDAINVLNTVEWAAPNTDPGNSNFGVITAQRNEPRWLQFQGRFTF